MHAKRITHMKDSPAVIAYSPRTAAEVSSLSLRTVMTAIASGELRSVKKGRRRIVFAVDLENYLRSAQPAPTPEADVA
jgi:excisionase family DNA binding protein